LDLDTLQQRIDISPYQRWLGLQAAAVDAQAVVLRLPWRAEFDRGDGAGELHGGITATLIDIAGYYALTVRAAAATATISMTVDYLRMAGGGVLDVRGEAVKIGRRVSLSDVKISDAEGRLIAVGRATYAMASAT
jgi:uncharacterized protein (TIGR00369 family)